MVDQKDRRGFTWRSPVACLLVVIALCLGPEDESVWPWAVLVFGMLGAAVWLLKGEK